MSIRDAGHAACWVVSARAGQLGRGATVCLVLMLAVAVSPGGWAEDTTPTAILREQAFDAYRARNAEQATELLRHLVQRTPEAADAWHGLSRALEWSGDLGAAADAGARAQDLGFVWRSGLSYRVAGLYARAGVPAQALNWLERSLAERYEDRPGLWDDAAFETLRADPRFARLAGRLPVDTPARDEGWRFDLEYLVEEARRLHADPARPVDSPEFAREVRSLREEIPTLDDDTVRLRMMRLLAILNDGHTAIFGPTDRRTLTFERRSLPVKLYAFPDGLYIVDGEDEGHALIGARIARIGGIATEDVLSRMSTYRGVDNSMTWLWMGPQFYMRQLAMLRAVGVPIGADGRVELTLVGRDGVTSTVTLAGGDHANIRKLRPSPITGAAAPRWLSRVDTNFWLQPLPDHGALYFQFNQVRDADGESIEEFSERLRSALEGPDVRTVIVDVRHNNGGNNTLVAPLVRALIEFDMRTDRDIWVLTGRNTFSAAQNFCNRVERWTDATFAGEPSASRPNFVGESTTLLLPYSGLNGSISSRYWQDSDPGDHRAWIEPDLPVTLTAEDYFAGRDPVMEAVLQRLRPDAVAATSSPSRSGTTVEIEAKTTRVPGE